MSQSSTRQLFQQIDFVLSTIAKNNSSRSSFVPSLFRSQHQQKTNSLFTFPNQKNANMINFLYHLEKQSEATDEIYIVALCLLLKLESTLAYTRVTPKTVHGVYWACFALAFKYLEDEVFTDEDFALIAEIELTRFVAIELEYLRALSFNATVTESEFQSMKQKLTDIWNLYASSSLEFSKKTAQKPFAKIHNISDLYTLSSVEVASLSSLSSSSSSLFSSSSKRHTRRPSKSQSEPSAKRLAQQDSQGSFKICNMLASPKSDILQIGGIVILV